MFDAIGHKKKRAFLAAYAETGTVKAACEAAEISRATFYTKQWQEDEDFRAAFAHAQDMAAETLENEARRRAVEGVKEPVGWYKGQPGGYVTRYSDTLLIFLMKGAMPEKYRERYEHTGPGGAALTFNIDISSNGRPDNRVSKTVAR